MLLPCLTLGALIPAVLLSTLELAAKGALGPSVVALDAIAVILLPFGLLSLFFTLRDRWSGNPPSDSDDDGGGGGGWEGPRPDPPSGGLEIDWDRFEAELHAWTEARKVPA